MSGDGSTGEEIKQAEDRWNKPEEGEEVEITNADSHKYAFSHCYWPGVYVDKRHWEALQAVVKAARQAFSYQGIRIEDALYDEELISVSIPDLRAYFLAVRALDDGTAKE